MEVPHFYRVVRCESVDIPPQSTRLTLYFPHTMRCRYDYLFFSSPNNYINCFQIGRSSIMNYYLRIHQKKKYVNYESNCSTLWERFRKEENILLRELPTYHSRLHYLDHLLIFTLCGFYKVHACRISVADINGLSYLKTIPYFFKLTQMIRYPQVYFSLLTISFYS